MKRPKNTKFEYLTLVDNPSSAFVELCLNPTLILYVCASNVVAPFSLLFSFPQP